MEMSITRALVELKNLDSRINRAINSGIYIAGAKKSSKKINNIFTREDFDKRAKADYQSAIDLIKRRKMIKSKVVESNAKTMVKINNVEMSVADAIERKDSIDYERALLSEMEKQYNSVLINVRKENEKVDANLQKLLEASFGKEGKQKTSPEEVDAIANPFKEQNQYEVINPLELQNKIKEFRDEIEGFMMEVDFTLTTSNSLTMIKIEEQ
jgi:hypothetical protein